MSKRGSLKKQKRRKALVARKWRNSDGKLVCHWCRSQLPRVGWTVDHVIPLSAGGTNDLINLVPCCHECNALRNVLHRDAGIVVSDPTKIKESTNVNNIE